MSVYQALITIDPATFVVQMCNLFIQIFVLKTRMLNPVKKVLAERQAKADADIAAAKQASAEAAAIKAEYEQNMAEAKAQANEIVAAAQKTAAARTEEMLNDARTTAAQIKQKAEADAAQEKKKAVNELKDEIGGIAMQIASKVVEREISEQDHAALIDEFIRNVGEHHDRSGKAVRRQPVRFGRRGRAGGCDPGSAARAARCRARLHTRSGPCWSRA